MRLIDVDALAKHFKALANIEWNRRAAPKSWADSYNNAIETLEDYPTIDAEPVKHGRWVLKERAHYFKCSLCKEPIPYKFGYTNSRRYYNYCPNCGAKMDGKAQENT